ncbi:hypothetical protein E4U43_008698 [Claviceps pusilla]|uniref:Cytochrome P450 n=1 Tax=Claviceps pusilla TaxID=123648 RepID=A0A9P7NCT5_9HYPO|nr:hypothetical protein E4U43_008698 [Claviceps pusilla]
MINALIVVCLLLLVAIYVRHRAYPRPYKDIPHSTQSARRILGDIPDILQFIQDGNDPDDYISHRCRQLNSPIIQLFFMPFTSPLIFLDDVGESESIVVSRTKELDRAPMTVNTFLPFFPLSSILKRTTPEWRAQRRLWKDAMGHDFLRHIAAPHTYKVALELAELFRLKTDMAKGRPFSMRTDFNICGLDVIWAAFLGSELHGIRDAICGVRETHHDDSFAHQPASVDSPAVLPPTVKGELYEAIEFLNQSLNLSLTSWLPGWYHWLLRQAPKYRRAWALKTKIINDHIQMARERVAASSSQQVDGSKMCAMDMALCREQGAIARPNAAAFVIPPTDKEMHDELFMLLIAGHETTATTLCWCVKLLTNNAEPQGRLRAALKAALPALNQLTVDDILNTDIPYLDAALEECVRLASIVPRIVRVALDDTEILGYHIPRGAQILCTTYVCAHTLRKYPKRGDQNGHEDEKGVASSPIDSPTEDMDAFSPERWLDDAGAFNSQAVSKMSFSGGPRELRILLVVLLMSFELESIPEELNSMRTDPGALRIPRQAFVRLRNLD